MEFPRHPFFLAARLERRLPERRTLAFRSFAGAIASVAALLAFISPPAVGGDRVLGVALLALAAYIFFFLWGRFLGSNRRRRSLWALPESAAGLEQVSLSENAVRYLDFASAAVLAGVPGHGDPRAIFRELFRSSLGRFFLERTALPQKKFSQELEHAITTGPQQFSYASFLEYAVRSAIGNRHLAVTPADLFTALAGPGSALERILVGYSLSAADFDEILHWWRIAEAHHREKSFLKRLLESPGIGKTWAFGYTPTLDRYASPVERPRDDESHILAHRANIRTLEVALAKSSAANAMIVGEPGVGKMTLVKGFAERSWSGRALPGLNYRRVLKLEMKEVLGAVSSGAPQTAGGGVAALLEKIFRDVEWAGNVVLVIEDIDLYLAPNSSTHIAETLLPFLRSNAVKVIGLASGEGYSRSVAGNPALESLFGVVRIEEPGEHAMLAILGDVSLALEKKHKQIILYQSLKRIYELSLRYASSLPFPEKGIAALEETFIAAREARRKDPIAPNDVDRIFEQKFGAVVGGVGKAEQALLLNLEEKLHERVIGQAEAIRALSDAIRRKRSGVAAGSKPAGSFLFLGPTGVGKTETAKALAAIYYGSEERMIRFDMTEYQGAGDIRRLIGSRESNDVGALTEAVRAQPFSLILLDEIEKAHPRVIDLFLQVLDEGRLTDAFHKRIDFTNAFIIATSNAGSEFIRQSLDAGMPHDALKRSLLDHVLRKGIFKPEFVNRFDGAIAYSPLPREDVRRVASLMLGKLKARLAAEGYRLVWGEALLDWLADHGYSPVFGGRELRRVIQEKIESQLAKDLIAGKYPKGATITLAIPEDDPAPAAPPH